MTATPGAGPPVRSRWDAGALIGLGCGIGIVVAVLIAATTDADAGVGIAFGAVGGTAVGVILAAVTRLRRLLR